MGASARIVIRAQKPDRSVLRALADAVALAESFDLNDRPAHHLCLTQDTSCNHALPKPT